MNPGSRLGHYEVLESLGSGGMGEVYRARDATLRRNVAIKVLPEGLADDPERLARLQREARLLASLNHPGIATIHSLEEVDGARFLVLELIEGATLRELVVAGEVEIERTLRICAQIAEALECAHRSGIVHRDLKPSNVLLTTDDRVKVLDFGIAREVRDSDTDPDTEETDTLTRSGALVGTCPYISPERIRGHAADARSDIWSFGCLLYEMLARRRAFPGETAGDTLSAILDREPDYNALPAATPPAIRELVRSCLNKDPEKRPRSADALRTALETELERLAQSNRPGRTRSRQILAVVATGVVAVVITASWLLYKQTRIRWVQTQAIPELERLAGAGSPYGPSLLMWEAHTLATAITAVTGDDPVVERSWAQVARDLTVQSDPPGAAVYAKPYPEPDREWEHVGTSPLTARLPIGYHRVRIEKDGHEPFEGLTPPRGSRPFEVKLAAVGAGPDDMVQVAGGSLPLFFPGFDHLREPVPPFLIDRFEVTNRQFRDFVDAGGYADPIYWQHPIIEGSRELSWEAAMARFVDATGRSGPASWEIGGYADGADDHPVGGVSWYEAAAYARFVDKTLPTLFHWNHAATTPAGVEIAPLSILESNGPERVGTSRAISAFGSYDMAGNVREWVLNPTGTDGHRYLLGGGWDDPSFMFVEANSAPAMDRSLTNGIRLMRPSESPEPNTLARPIARVGRDFLAEAPVSDATFEIFMRQFAYDPTELEAVVESETPTPDWLRQEVSFNAAYGEERIAAVMLLPVAVAPPWQAVVVFPGSSALNRPNPDSFIPAIDFLVRSGRAVVIPAYKGTYSRQDEMKSDYPDESNAWKEHIVMWAKDLSLTVDYLESRTDIASDQIAYFGFSWGATLGSIVLATEQRFAASVLYNGGLQFQRAQPEVDQINYVGRVTGPVLMVNGDHDFIFPTETSQRPLYDLLGTPQEHKRWVLFPGSHWAPKNDLIRETLGWLDRYLGPVSR